MAATLGELAAALDRADKAGDVKAARELAAAVHHMQSSGLQLYEPPEPKLTFVEGVKEAVTGDKRKTATTEGLPDWATMPELNSLSLASAKTGVGTLLSSPAETAQIIKANFPAAQVRQDEKGNWVIKSAADGKEYAIKPGFQVSDIPRALGALAAFTPAGAARTVPGMIAAAAGTQAVIEGSQAATGGNFDPKEVTIAGAVGGAVPLVVKAVKAVAQPAKAMLDEVLTGAKPAPAASAIPPASPPGGAAPIAPAPVTPPPAAPVAPVAPMAGEELAQTAKKAAEGGLGSSKAKQVLAEQAAPDPKTVEAANRLGITDYLQPDHVTTSQAYRELAQAVKSIPGSEARTAEIQGLNSVGKRADDLITEIGGFADASSLDKSVKARLSATQAELDKKANALYKQMRENIPPKSEAPAPSVLEFITQRADELGGKQNLTSMEKTILSKLAPKEIKDAQGVVTEVKQPTYALLDDVRRDLTAAKYKRQGAFKDADTGLIKKLEMELMKDQKAAVEPFGMIDVFEAARSAVRLRKGVEDDLVSLFGKTVDGSLVGDLSGAVKSLPSGDASKLIKFLKVIPEEMRQEVVTTGLHTAFGKSIQNGSLNFNTYARWYEGLLKNKQAYTALMTELPLGARKQLSDLYRVSKAVSMATRERITTGRIQAVKDELIGTDTLISNLYNLAKRSGAGLAAEAVTTPLGMPGSGMAAGLASALTKGKPNAVKAVDALVASPEFAQAVKDAAKGNAKVAAKRIAYSKQFTKFVRAVGSPKELSNREQWILQLLEAQNQAQGGRK